MAKTDNVKQSCFKSRDNRNVRLIKNMEYKKYLIKYKQYPNASIEEATIIARSETEAKLRLQYGDPISHILMQFIEIKEKKLKNNVLKCY